MVMRFQSPLVYIEIKCYLDIINESKSDHSGYIFKMSFKSFLLYLSSKVYMFSAYIIIAWNVDLLKIRTENIRMLSNGVIKSPKTMS